MSEQKRRDDEFILWEFPFGKDKDTVFAVVERTFRMSEQCELEEDELTCFTSIKITDFISALKLCEKKNKEEVFRANDSLNKWKEKAKSLPKSELLDKRVAYFEDILGLYVIWYDTMKKKLNVNFPIAKLSPEKQSTRESRQRKSNIINYNYEVTSYIKANLRFYRNPQNEGEHPTQEQLAGLMKMDDSSLSRRLTGVNAPVFLPKLQIKIDEVFKTEPFENAIGRPQEDDDKNILSHLAIDINDKIAKMKIGMDSPIKRSKEKRLEIYKDEAGNEYSPQLDEHSKKVVNFFDEIDEGTDLKRICDYCDKEYNIYISEDSDLEEWGKAAKKKPQYYRKLVCSDECYKKLLEQNNLDPIDYPI